MARSRIAVQIRAVRRRLRWTQAELTERLGVDSMTVSRWERGAVLPRRVMQDAIGRLAEPTIPASLPSPPPTETARRFSEHESIDELIRVVGVQPARMALRKLALLQRPSSAVTFPVDPSNRLRELDVML